MVLDARAGLPVLVSRFYCTGSHHPRLGKLKQVKMMTLMETL